MALRGWNYPHIPRSEPPQGIGGLPDGGIEAVTATGRYQEVWRLHPSGLFTHRWCLREDSTGYSGTINVVAAVYTVAEVFEFGRRLYQEDTGPDGELLVRRRQSKAAAKREEQAVAAYLAGHPYASGPSAGPKRTVH